MVKTLISMHGLPRSGKSTLTHRLVDYFIWTERQNVAVVNADAVRLALHGQRYAGEAEPFVFAIREVMVRALFEAGHDVIIYDETNFSRATRDRMRSSKWESRYVHVPTSPEVCKQRAIATGQPDLLPVIDAMQARYEPLGDDELRFVLPNALAATL